MKKYSTWIIGLFLLFGMNACKNNSKAYFEIQAYRAQGDSISILSQQTIFKKLTNAVATSGIVAAVDYCSVNALPITDSLSAISKVQIQRLSNKNRNKLNKIIEKQDQDIFDYFLEHNNELPKDTIIKEGEVFTYYKPIKITMPTCLNCHGNSSLNLNADVAKIINKKYPNDLATGYKLGDLRGIWKIKFKENLSH